MLSRLSQVAATLSLFTRKPPLQVVSSLSLRHHSSLPHRRRRRHRTGSDAQTSLVPLPLTTIAAATPVAFSSSKTSPLSASPPHLHLTARPYRCVLSPVSPASSSSSSSSLSSLNTNYLPEYRDLYLYPNDTPCSFSASVRDDDDNNAPLCSLRLCIPRLSSPSSDPILLPPSYTSSQSLPSPLRPSSFLNYRAQRQSSSHLRRPQSIVARNFISHSHQPIMSSSQPPNDTTMSTAASLDDSKSGAASTTTSVPSATSAGMEHRHTNRLIDEQSPYLLQHAHNPVDWYPWYAKPHSLSLSLSVCVCVCVWMGGCMGVGATITVLSLRCTHMCRLWSLVDVSSSIADVYLVPAFLSEHTCVDLSPCFR